MTPSNNSLTYLDRITFLVQKLNLNNPNSYELVETILNVFHGYANTFPEHLFFHSPETNTNLTWLEWVHHLDLLLSKLSEEELIKHFPQYKNSFLSVGRWRILTSKNACECLSLLLWFIRKENYILLGHPQFSKDFYQNILKNTESVKFEGPILAALSSGTTGNQKIVVHSLKSIILNIIWGLESFSQYLPMFNRNVAGPPLTFLSVLPLQHFGGHTVIWRSALVGGTIIQTNSLPHYLKTAPIPPDFISLVPAQVYDLVHTPLSTGQRKSCGAILVGGGSLDKGLLLKALEQGFTLSSSYGLTETAGTLAGTPFFKNKNEFEDYEGLANTLGIPNQWPLLKYKGRVVENKYQESHLKTYQATQNENLHHFLIKGETLALGHFLDGQWFSYQGQYESPDFGRVINFNMENYLVIEGRRPTLLNVGGEKINPQLILDTIRNNGINNFDGKIISMPDERLGECPILFYQCKELSGPEHILDYEIKIKKSLETLPSFWRPKIITPLPPDNFFINTHTNIKPSANDLLEWARIYQSIAFSLHTYRPADLNKLSHGKPSVLFAMALHGFMGQQEDFVETFNFLQQDLFHHSKVNFMWLGIDLGYTLERRPRSLDSLAKDLNYFFSGFTSIVKQMFQYSTFKTLLIGYSQGGRLALQMSSQVSEVNLHIDHFVLLSANPHWQDIGHEKGQESGQENRNEKIAEKKSQADEIIENFFHDLKSEVDHNSSYNQRLPHIEALTKKFMLKWYQLPLFGQITHSENFHQLIDQRLTFFPHCLSHWELQYRHLGRRFAPPMKIESLKYWVNEKTEDGNKNGPICTYVFGDLDESYKKAAVRFQQMGFECLSVPNVAHALLQERPKILAQILSKHLLKHL